MTTTTPRRWLLAPALLALLTTLTGCPYETKTPLDAKPAVAVDASLLGRWEDREDKDYTYTVSKESAMLYKVVKAENKTPKEASDTYYAFASKVGNELFLNVYEGYQSESDSKTYKLYKLVQESKERLRLQEVSDGVDEQFETGAELRAFVAKYKDLSFFYGKSDKEMLRKLK